MRIYIGEWFYVCEYEGCGWLFVSVINYKNYLWIYIGILYLLLLLDLIKKVGFVIFLKMSFVDVMGV